LHSLPAIVVSLVVLCVGMFAVQSTAPAFVNANALGSKGAAGALYVDVLLRRREPRLGPSGYAWQAWGWPGVAGTCVTALAVGLVADGVLVRVRS
jgi:YNFM family putative membrane transporter